MKKRVKVHMLPTKDESQILVNKYIMIGSRVLPYEEAQALHGDNTDEQLEERGYEHQHLYFTTDEEIKAGDWYYDEVDNKIYFCIAVNDPRPGMVYTSDNGVNKENAHKIIATTDNSLLVEIPTRDYTRTKSYYEKVCLPSPSQEFIKEYCKNPVDEVEVEYECLMSARAALLNVGTGELSKETDSKCIEDKLKVTSNNEIIIYPIKDSWSREEVTALCDEAYHAGYETCQYDSSLTASARKFSIDEWIKKNL